MCSTKFLLHQSEATLSEWISDYKGGGGGYEHQETKLEQNPKVSERRNMYLAIFLFSVTFENEPEKLI